MCGIAGFFNFNAAPADPLILTRMIDCQRHRGPDDHGMRLFSLQRSQSIEFRREDPPSSPFFEGALGFNRLSILDLSERGHQPMCNDNESVILAFNGEIYNAFDYKPELESAGYRFRSRTDTEVILRLYEHVADCPACSGRTICHPDTNRYQIISATSITKLILNKYNSNPSHGHNQARKIDLADEVGAANHAIGSVRKHGGKEGPRQHPGKDHDRVCLQERS
jgi:glutamine phosphoribosylpyrophosphate amidotransferase